MEGFPYYFHVRAGNPVLKSPLYQQYNMLSIAQIAQLENGNGFKNLIDTISNIIQTNDNMPILWYLRNILKTAKELGIVN
jgi:hypothetical protein